MDGFSIFYIANVSVGHAAWIRKCVHISWSDLSWTSKNVPKPLSMFWGAHEIETTFDVEDHFIAGKSPGSISLEMLHTIYTYIRNITHLNVNTHNAWHSNGVFTPLLCTQIGSLLLRGLDLLLVKLIQSSLIDKCKKSVGIYEMRGLVHCMCGSRDGMFTARLSLFIIVMSVADNDGQ